MIVETTVERVEIAAFRGEDWVTWRVVSGDNESRADIAPVCPDPVLHVVAESGIDQSSVYDCCPGPHIEIWSESLAIKIVELLNGGQRR
jgi:hypothetical protein